MKKIHTYSCRICSALKVSKWRLTNTVLPSVHTFAYSLARSLTHAYRWQSKIESNDFHTVDFLSLESQYHRHSVHINYEIWFMVYTVPWHRRKIPFALFISETGKWNGKTPWVYVCSFHSIFEWRLSRKRAVTMGHPSQLERWRKAKARVDFILRWESINIIHILICNAFGITKCQIWLVDVRPHEPMIAVVVTVFGFNKYAMR